MLVGICLSALGQEVIAMPHRLHEYVNRPKRERHDRDKLELQLAVGRPRPTGGERRQDQRHAAHGNQGGKPRARALRSE